MASNPRAWTPSVVNAANESAARYAPSESDQSVEDWETMSQLLSHIWEPADVESSTTKAREPSIVTLAESFAGMTLGPFEILDVIGCGAFGLVFRAKDQRLGREVAIKIPKPNALTNGNTRERFLHEARLAAVLRHPGIVQVYEVGEAGPMVFIASEFCVGPTLAEYLEHKKQLKSTEAACILRDISDAVGFAHLRGVIHQDLKPSNVLMDKRGGDSDNTITPRVTDFGLALRAKAPTPGSKANLGGTPGYMSPEQAAGDASSIGTYTDVFALGMMLWQMIDFPTPSRSHPPANLQLGDADHSGKTAPPSAGESRTHKIPRDLVAIANRCIEHAPAKRYQNGHELRDDLRRFLTGDPVLARPVTATGRLWKSIKRHPALAAVAISLIAVVMASLMGLSVMLARERALRKLDDLHRDEARQVVSKFYTEFVEQWMLNDANLTPEQEKLMEESLHFYENWSAERPEDLKRLHDVSIALHRAASIYAFRNHTDKAVKARERGLDILSVLLNRDPANREYRYDRFYNALSLSYYHASRGDRSAGIRLYEQATSDIDELVAEDPNNFTYLDARISLRSSSPIHYDYSGDPQRLAAEMDDVAAEIRKLLKNYPDNESLMRHLAEVLAQGTIAANGTDRVDVFLCKCDESISLYRELVRRNPRRWEYQGALFGVLYSRGEFLADRGDYLTAERDLNESLSIASELADNDPENPSRHMGVANCKMRLGRVYYDTGRIKEARELLSRSRDTMVRCIELVPDSEMFRRQLGGWREYCPIHDLVQELDNRRTNSP